MRMRTTAFLSLVLFVLASLTACGGGGGGATTNETPISLGVATDGDLATNDIETWTFNLSQDSFISVELFGSRIDQEGWTTSTTNAPKIALIDYQLSTSGSPPALTHDSSISAWAFGLRDMEIPMYFLKSGSYAIQVSRQNTANEGSVYTIRINDHTSEITSNYGGYLTESEKRGEYLNERTTGTPESIAPISGSDLILVGHFEDNGQSNPDDFENDVYKITIDPDTNPAVIACVEIFAYRNGIWQAEPDYFDPELTFYSPADVELNTVDDGFYRDPKICQKVTVAGDYQIKVTESFTSPDTVDSDYILVYTEEPILSTQDETEPNDDPIPVPGNETVINDFGYLVNGEVSDSDIVDWYSINVDAGDMISIRQFDYENSVDSTGGAVKFEVYKYVSTPSPSMELIPFNGPAPSGDGRTADLYSDLTTTFFAPATENYRIKVTKDTSVLGGASTRNYSFILNRKQATPESESNSNPDGSNASNFSANGTAFGEITLSDSDYFKLDPSVLNITAGDYIAVHIYATRDIDNKAFDSTGFGSTLEPKITVFDDSIPSSIASSTFLNDSSSDVVSEGLSSPYATLTTVFKETGSNFYYFKVEGLNSTTGQYFIEAVNLGQ